MLPLNGLSNKWIKSRRVCASVGRANKKAALWGYNYQKNTSDVSSEGPSSVSLPDFFKNIF